MSRWIKGILADLREMLTALREMLALLQQIHEEVEAISKLLGQIEPGNAPGARFTVHAAQPK